MGSATSKIRRVIRDEGVLSLLNRVSGAVYRTGIRPWLPGEPIRYAGVAVAFDRKFGDDTIPRSWVPDVRDKPDYESALIGALKESVKPGDRVVVVGGGLGVTTTIAAQLTGPSGHVGCYEGSRENVKHIRTTIKRNLLNNVEVHHAIIAKQIVVYGPSTGFGNVIEPSGLPHCDVLELDCEGAEQDILRHLKMRPRCILVETHGVYGAPTSLISKTLTEGGYVVRDLGIAESAYEAFCRENDIHVLSAERAGAG